MAALAGAVTLGSCVKDDVSSSVEAVRNAKAEELRGLAAEHNANATLAIASAAVENARVALVNAQAALEKANAEAAQANADFEKAQLAARIDAAVSAFEAQTQVNKNALVDALNAASLQEANFIGELIARFNSAYSKYTTAQQTLINAQSKLAKAMIGQADEEAMNAAYIQGELNTIAQEKAKIAFLETLTSENMTANDQAVAAANYAAQLADAKAEFDQSDVVKAFVAASKDFAEKLAAYTEYHNLDGTADGLIEAAFGTYFMPTNVDDIPSAVLAYELYNSYAMAAQDIEANIGGDLGGGQTFSGTIQHYAVSEVGKYNFTDYLDNHTATFADPYVGTVKAKKAWNDAKDDLADLEDALGKSTDTKDSKTTRANNKTGDKQNPTLYAVLAQKNADLEAAKTAEATAKENVTKLPAAVQSAFKALWDVYDKTSSTPKDKASALHKFANAVEAAYGEAGYNHLPANIDYTVGGDRDEIAAFLFGNSGKTFADVDTKAEIEALVIAGSTLFTSTTALEAAFDVEKLDDIFGKVDGATGRKTGAKDVKTIYNDAKTKLGADTDAASPTGSAYAQQKAAKNAIPTQEANIRAKKDDIVNAEVAYNEAVNKRKQIEEAVAAVDLDKFEKVIDDLKKSLNAYNEAAIAMKTAENQINDIQKEANAIANLDPATDVPTQIANSNAAIAVAEDNLAKIGYNGAAPGSSVTNGDDSPAVYVWDPTVPNVNPITGETVYGAYVLDATVSLTYDELVDFYEAEVDAAETKLEAAAAELALATKALEQFEIDLDGEDEPETPAEGGETPAEGGEEA